jgi:hypothetical protein
LELEYYTEPWDSATVPVILFHYGLSGNGYLFRVCVPFLADDFWVLPDGRQA